VIRNPNQSDADKMKTVRREASRHSKQNKRKYTKGEINELETNNKNKKVTEF